MFVAIWKYEVEEGSIKGFEEFYGQNGKWVNLFRENTGYITTEFVQNIHETNVYLTVDKWESYGHYQNYLEKNKDEIIEIDAEGEELTVTETKIGWFKTVDL